MSVSVRDVATLAKVSVGTVSNVLNKPDRVSPQTAERVLAAIDQLGFVRNDAARQLRAGRSRTVGLVVLDVRNPFFTDLARGAESKASEAGISVMLGNADENEERELSYLELFEEQRVLGILISPMGDVTEHLVRLNKRGTPTVLVDRESEDPRFSSVSVDDVAGGYLAAEHLLAIGRRKLAFVGGPNTLRQVQDRLAGARKAVDEVPGASIEVIDTAALSVLEGREVGKAIAARPSTERPDAIFAANDLVAVGVMQALMFMDLVRIPEEIALIGYDDIDFASATVVPLSSIRQPSELIGHTALELLLRSAQEGDGAEVEHVKFQPALVVRSSTVATA